MVKLEPYWNSMLGEEAQLNDRNECIKFKRSGRWVEMDFELIQIMKIASFLSKAHNWKSPGMMKYVITDLKHSQLPTGILKNYSETIEESEELPDWLTTGNIYLLPKLWDNKEVRIYKHITCS